MRPRKSPVFRASITSSAAFTTTLILHLAAPSASAQSTRWWDGGTVDIAATGDGAASNANGTWSTSIANWDQGSGLAHVVWTNGNNIANFAGGSNTITLGSAITVGRINQTGGAAGITINGSGNALTLGSASTVFNVAANANTGRSMTMSAEVTGSNALSVVGPATSSNGIVNLNAINTFTGNLSTSGRVTLNIGNNGAAGQLNSGSYSGAISLGSTTSLQYGSSLGQTLSGLISGGGALTKNGSAAGTLTLTNNNTGFTGATTVSAGTLAVSSTGRINASSGVTINGGNFRYNSSTNLAPAVTFTSGTISGTNWNGTLAGQTIGTGQTISPGNSPGTAATVGQTWANGGSYLWEMNNATGTAGSDPGWDLLNGTGTLNITAASGSQFNLLVNSLALTNTAGLAANFDQSLSYNWLIADFATITGFTAEAFNINTTAFTNPFSGTFGVALGNMGSIGGDNSQIFLTYTPVPEPGAALLGGLGVLALLRRRR